jgi:hypothetical protein
MNKKIKRHQLPVSDHRLCSYGDIGESHHVAEPHDTDSRQAEYGISLGEWLETRDGAAQCVERAWDDLTPDRQLVIVMELLETAHRAMDILLDAVKEITCPSP